MRPLFLDLSSTFRNLRRAPFFVFISTGILALGIASNSVAFTVVNSVFLRPLAYPHADQIVIVQGHERNRNVIGDLEAPAYFLVRGRAASLEDVAAMYPSEAGVNLAGVGTVSYVKSLRVSRDFFRTLGSRPILGRTFDEIEDRPTGPHVAVLSYALWSRQLSQLRIDGSHRLRIDGDEYTAIGVMPQSFHSYPEVDLWLPLQLEPGNANQGTDYRVVARLRSGVSVEQAQEELKQLSVSYPLTQNPAEQRISLVVTKLQDFQTHDARRRLKFLSMAVFLVLLIACTNIAMLLLVRTSARTHEIAIRCALGSSRARLLQLFLFEGGILALLGAFFGIILAKETLPLVISLAPHGFAPTTEMRIDGRVVAFTLGISALTAALFAIGPAVKLSRKQLQAMLGETTLRATASAVHTRTGRLLLIIQVALTLILLSASTLLLHHLVTLEHVYPGFDSRQVFAAQVSFSSRAFTTTRLTVSKIDDIIQRLKSLSFVGGVASTNGLPLETGLNMGAHPTDAPGSIESVEYRLISQDYFYVMQIPVIQGRTFDAAYGPDAQPVAIVNETLARKWWPGVNAPGHFVTVGEELGPEFADKPRLVIGVATDIRQSSLDYPARPTIFLPIQQAPDPITAYANKYVLTSIIIRVSGSEDVSEQVRAAVASSDPDLSVASIRPLSQIVAESLAAERFYTFLTATFGAFALLTVTVGFYGLLSYQLSLRAREIAVRMGLGAKRTQIVMLAIAQGAQLVGFGAVLGGPGAFFLMRILASQVYNGRTMAAGAFVFAVLLLGLVSVLASSLTALQVASVEPMVILRNE